jgi:hypothetical protein
MNKSGSPFPKAATGAWNAFYTANPQDLYSDPITNGVAIEVTK